MAMKHELSLFLDESGAQHWPKKQNADLDRLWAITGGILLYPDQMSVADAFVRDLLLEVERWTGKRPKYLHTTDLMKGEKAFRGLTRDQSAMLAGRIVDFIEETDIRIVAARNNLATLAARRGRTDAPYLCTIESALAQTDLLCRKKNVAFRATLATNSHVSQQDIINFFTRVRTQTRIGSSEVPLESRRFDNLVEGVAFEEPRLNPYLQLADSVAWFAQRGDMQYLKKLQRLWLMDPFPKSESNAWSNPDLVSQDSAEIESLRYRLYEG